MSNGSDELVKLIEVKYVQLVREALVTACSAVAKFSTLRTLDEDRRHLFATTVRAWVYDYLNVFFKDHSGFGARLNHPAHRNMQSVEIIDDSGLRIRLIRLASVHVAPAQPALPGLGEQLQLDLEDTGADDTIVGLSWQTPAFDDAGEPIGLIPLTLVRPAAGTNLRDGKADLIHSFGAPPAFIPAAAFDPNTTDMTFTTNDDIAQQ